MATLDGPLEDVDWDKAWELVKVPKMWHKFTADSGQRDVKATDYIF